MKTSKYIYSFMLAVALAFAGCSDFLDSEDNSNIAGDNFIKRKMISGQQQLLCIIRCGSTLTISSIMDWVMDADSTFVRQPLIISILLPI